MLTQARLKEVLTYDPDTGVFTRRGISAKLGSLRSVGSVTGSVSKSTGYVRITVDYKGYLAHRLAWLYMTGEWPVIIDHINGVKSDNRWCNLRECTTAQNACNQPAKITNQSWFKGVCKVGERWKASIKVNGKSEHIGTFSSPELAAEAYKVRAAQVQGEFIHPSIS